MRCTFCLAAAFVLAASAFAWGLGADHGTRPVGGSDNWPPGLRELVNTDRRVHGYFVNWEDVFYFAGDTDALNAFLGSCARLPGTQVRVVLHPGKADVRSPWDKGPRDVAADWKLYASAFAKEQVRAAHTDGVPFQVRVDVWLGG
jgi:hypothetical protein